MAKEYERDEGCYLAKRFFGRLQTGFIDLFSIVLGTWKQMSAGDVQILAGSLAFATTMSIVPLLAVSLSVFKAFGGFENLFKKLEPFILQNFVEASGVHISNFIVTSIDRIQSGALGFTGAVALFITSTKLLLDMETAVHRMWHEKPQRLNVFRLVMYWIIMFVGPLIAAIALGVMGSNDLGLIKLIPHQTVVLVITFAAFVCINKFVPIARVRWTAAFVSAAMSAIGIGLAQSFYAQITGRVLRYSKIYGSLASIPIFLLWILVLWWIFLAGVALCAVLETRASRS